MDKSGAAHSRITAATATSPNAPVAGRMTDPKPMTTSRKVAVAAQAAKTRVCRTALRRSRRAIAAPATRQARRGSHAIAAILVIPATS